MVLAHQQGRGRQERHLLARHGRHEGRAQRHLGLAEADIAADQPVHRPAGSEIGQHRLDGAQLILGLLEREAGGELVVEPLRQLQGLARPQGALGRHLDQLGRQLADALLDLGLARLPAGAPQAVEIDLAVGAAVARQDVEALDRHEQPVAAVIDELQAVVRRTAHLERHQPLEPADAVLGMDDEVAVGDAGEILDEPVGPPGPLGAGDQPVAQKVELAQDMDAGGPKAALERQDGDRGPGHGLRLGPARDGGEVVEAVIGQHLTQALRRALAVRRQERLGPGADEVLQVRHDGIEQVDAAVGALAGEVAGRLPSEIAHRGDARRRHGRRAEDREIDAAGARPRRPRPGARRDRAAPVARAGRGRRRSSRPPGGGLRRASKCSPIRAARALIASSARWSRLISHSGSR